MTILWSKKAQKQQNQTADYIFAEFGEKAVRDFYTRLEELEKELSAFPELGKIEPLLTHRSRVYRSIVVSKKNKLIYSVETDCIRITALWDTRREPKKQAGNTK